MSSEDSRAAIKLQVESLNTLHQKVTASCWAKCVPLPVRDADLSMGEMTCVDRCVHKYLETQGIVRTELETARGKMPLDFP